MSAKKVTVDGLGKLPAFCHAVIAGDFIYVSGTLGTKEGCFELVAGGTGPETVVELSTEFFAAGSVELGAIAGDRAGNRSALVLVPIIIQ